MDLLDNIHSKNFSLQIDYQEDKVKQLRHNFEN